MQVAGVSGRGQRSESASERRASRDSAPYLWDASAGSQNGTIDGNWTQNSNFTRLRECDRHSPITF